MNAGMKKHNAKTIRRKENPFFNLQPETCDVRDVRRYFKAAIKDGNRRLNQILSSINSDDVAGYPV